MSTRENETRTLQEIYVTVYAVHRKEWNISNFVGRSSVKNQLWKTPQSLPHLFFVTLLLAH